MHRLYAIVISLYIRDLSIRGFCIPQGPEINSPEMLRDDCICLPIYLPITCIYQEKDWVWNWYILRNCQLASPKSVRPSCRPESQVRVMLQTWLWRLKTRVAFLCCCLHVKSLLLWRTSVFAHHAFNWLGEAHPHYGEWSALLKVMESRC